MKITRKFKLAGAVRLFFLAIASSLTMRIATAANGPPLYIAIDFAKIFAQRYDVHYFHDADWAQITTANTTVTLAPRFSFEQTSPLQSYYKYFIYLKDRNNPNSDFYVIISTSKDRCISHATTASRLYDETLGVVYNVTTQYTDLSIGSPSNSNVSTTYSVCSRDNTLSVRFFDPISSGIPIGIGSYVEGINNDRVSETYIMFNTEGIIYP